MEFIIIQSAFWGTNMGTVWSLGPMPPPQFLVEKSIMDVFQSRTWESSPSSTLIRVIFIATKTLSCIANGLLKMTHWLVNPRENWLTEDMYVDWLPMELSGVTILITYQGIQHLVSLTSLLNHPDWCSKGRRMAASSNFFLKCHFTMYWHCQMSNLTSPSKIVLDMPNPIHTLYILRNMYALLSILIAISGQVDIHTHTIVLDSLKVVSRCFNDRHVFTSSFIIEYDHSVFLQIWRQYEYNL